MGHGIGHADAIDDVLEHRLAPLTRPVIQNIQAVGSRSVGRYAIPQRHYRLPFTIVQHYAAWSSAQRPLYEMGWNTHMVILHQAASFFQKIKNRSIIYEDTSAFEYIQTGTM